MSTRQPCDSTTVTQGNVARTGKEYVYLQTNNQSEISKRTLEKRLHKIACQYFFAHMM